MLKLDVRGFAGINKSLMQLGGKKGIAATRSGVGAGAAVVRRKAKSKAPKRSGLLKKAIKSKSNKTRGTIVSASAFVDSKIAPHGHLIEFGHRIVARGTAVGGGTGGASQSRAGRGGPTIGSVPPRPFLRSSFFGSKNKILKAVAKKMRERIAKFRAS